MKTFRLVALISMGRREYKEQEMSLFCDGDSLLKGMFSILERQHSGVVVSQ